MTAGPDTSEVDPDVVITLQRQQISQLMWDNTLKAARIQQLELIEQRSLSQAMRIRELELRLEATVQSTAPDEGDTI